MGDCGTIPIVTRLLAILTFAFVVFAGSHAEAQVFKPRGKAGATKAPKKTEKPAKSAKADDKPDDDKVAAKPKARRGATTTAAKTTKKSRAAESGRPSDLTPGAKKGKKGKKGADEDEDVASADVGDDEVIITDDDD